MKIAPLLSILQGFNIAFDFPVFLIGRLFPCIWSMNILLLSYLIESFKFTYL